jgi:hypothetical protein
MLYTYDGYARAVSEVGLLGDSTLLIVRAHNPTLEEY